MSRFQHSKHPSRLFAAASLAMAVWLLAAVLPYTAYAGSCFWTGAVSSNWVTPGNWGPGCSGAGGIPASIDDVTIPSAGVTNEPDISSNDVTIHNLTVAAGRMLTLGSGRTLTINGGTVSNNGTVSGSGTLRTQSSSYLYNHGTFSPPLEVASGTTNANGTFGSMLSVASGATLRALADSSYPMTVNGNVTVNGTLSGDSNSSTFTFNGSAFTNNGAVTVADTQFYGIGAQSIAGTGTWTGTGYLRIGGSSTTSLSNAITFATGLYVNSGGALDLGSQTLTLNGDYLYHYGTVSGSGTFRTQSSAYLYNHGTFSPPLEVASGTTDANGTFGSTLSVASGATLRVLYDSSYPMTVNGNVTVNGTLSGDSNSSDFVFNGSAFTNNGAVTVADTQFYGIGAQSIAGTGTWTGNGYLRVGGSSTTSLSNAITFATGLYVNSGGTLDLGSQTLTLNGDYLYHYGTVSGSGTFRTQSSAYLYNHGTFSPPLEVASGTTDANGTFGSTLSVASGATLRVLYDSSYPMTVNGNVTVNGTLSGDSNSSDFVFNGSTFSNNGAVTVADTQFYGIGAQSIAGTGTWTGLYYLRVGGSSTTSLSNAITFGTGLYVNSGGTLDLGSQTLTLNGKTLINYGTVSGSGTFHTQSSSYLYNYGTFDAPLEVASGTTDANGTFGSTLSVASGATLRVLYDSSYPMTVNGNVTVDGTLSGESSSSRFVFNGSTFTNNGAVSTGYVEFASGVPTLTGPGSFFGNYARVLGGTTLTLGSDHQLSRIYIYSGGTMDITGRTLSLSGSGTPLTNNGALTTAGSTIAYNGSSAQTVATTNVTYNNLAIDNGAGVTLSAAESVPGTLTLANGVFTIGSYLTLGNGATIVRSGGSLAAAPTFGASVHVQYAGDAAITTGHELPTATSVLTNLINNNTTTVNLNQDQTVNGAFILAAGTFNVGTRTLTLKGAVSAPGGVLASGTTGTVAFTQSAAGQAVLDAQYGNLTFDAFGKVLPSSGGVRIAGVFTAPAAAGHTLTGSTVEFNGASAQQLPAGFPVYNNLILNNTAGTTGVAGLTVDSLLRVQAGTFTTASDFNHVQIDAGATLSAGGDITVSGNFTNNGGFVHGSGTLRFNSNTLQNLVLNVPTTFFNLTIANGTTLVETVAADNATVAGTLTNQGVIRKTRAVAGFGVLSLGLTSVNVNVTTQGSLSQVQVDRVDQSHPNANALTATGRYWTVTPTGAGYTVDLTLLRPAAVTTNVLACRNDASEWNCACSASTATTITRSGITQLSDWAVGMGATVLTIQEVAGHWGVTTGGPNFDPLFDMDRNGVIDIRDIMLVSSLWNTGC